MFLSTGYSSVSASYSSRLEVETQMYENAHERALDPTKMAAYEGYHVDAALRPVRSASKI